MEQALGLSQDSLDELATGAGAPSARPHPRQTWGPPWLPTVSHRTQIDTFWLLVAMLMLAMGVIFFGWRGMLGASATWLAALAVYLMVSMLMQLFRPGRLQDSGLHVLTMGLMLGVSLPVMRHPMIPMVAGAVLGVLCHAMGRSHRLRIHPVAAAIVLAWVIPHGISHFTHATYHARSMVTEPAVLRMEHLVVGDLFHLSPDMELQGTWWESLSAAPYHAQRMPEPSHMLLGSDIPGHGNRLADMLSQSKLPRVEELLLGCVPGPIGATSKAVILILGVYIMYRGLAWWPVAAGGLLAAAVTLSLMPVKVDGQWVMMAQALGQMGLAMSFVYVGYFMLVGPLLWILMILSPFTAPMSSRGKIIYGVVIGATAAMAMHLTGDGASAYLGLLLASALTRSLDALQQSPMLAGR